MSAPEASTSQAPNQDDQARYEAAPLPTKHGEIGYPTVTIVEIVPPSPPPPPPPAASTSSRPSRRRLAQRKDCSKAKAFFRRHALAAAWAGLAASVLGLIVTSAGYAFCLRILVDAHRNTVHRLEDHPATMISSIATAMPATHHRRALVERQEGRPVEGRGVGGHDPVRFHKRRRGNAGDKSHARRQEVVIVDGQPAISVPASLVSELRSLHNPSNLRSATTSTPTASTTASTSTPTASATMSPQTQANSSSFGDSSSNKDMNIPSSIFVHGLFILAILSELVIIWKCAKRLWWVICTRRLAAACDASASGRDGEDVAAPAEADEGLHPVEREEQRRQRDQESRASQPTPTQQVRKESSVEKWLNILFGKPPEPVVAAAPRLPTYNAALGFTSDGRRRARGRRWRDGTERGTGDAEDLEVERNRRGGAPPAYNSDEQIQHELLLSGPAIRRALSALSRRFSSRSSRRASAAPSSIASMHTAEGFGDPVPSAPFSPAGSVRASIASFAGLIRRFSLLGGPGSSSAPTTPTLERGSRFTLGGDDDEKELAMGEEPSARLFGRAKTAARSPLQEKGDVFGGAAPRKSTIHEEDEDDSDSEGDHRKTSSATPAIVAFEHPLSSLNPPSTPASRQRPPRLDLRREAAGGRHVNSVALGGGAASDDEGDDIGLRDMRSGRRETEGVV